MNYRAITRQLPPRLRETVRRSLIYADVDVDYEDFIGFTLVFGVALSFAVSMDAYLIWNLNPLIGFVGTFTAFLTLMYTLIFFMIHNRSSFIDTMLPDALQLMSSNIRAGLTTDRSLLLSARSEFGPLKKEISIVGKRIFAGGIIEDELLGMTKRVKSKIFDRTILLIVQGIKSGGSLERLLIQTADDLRKQESLRKEIQATVLMYSILIAFAVVLAAPFLFGVSSYLAEVLGSRMTSFAFVRGLTSTTNFEVGAATIPPETLFRFSIASLTMSSVFGGLAIGLIQEGEEKVGVKYIPILLLLSLTVFVVTRSAMLSIFGSLIV